MEKKQRAGENLQGEVIRKEVTLSRSCPLYSFKHKRREGGGRRVASDFFLILMRVTVSVCCVLREGVNKVTDITEGRNRRCFQHLALYLPLRLQKHMNIIHNLEREK